jgi:hypothetical protein
MLTMRPGDPAAMSRRATSQARMYGPRRLVPRTWSIKSIRILWARCASGTPALFTAMVTVPTAFSASSTAAMTASASVMSILIG